MRDINDLLEIMCRLRDPEHGCPWDLEQDFASIAPYTLEEAYEVADAIQRGDLEELRDELGDLLFQVVFHAQMASERGAFGFADVVAAIADKITRRHPHVFAGAAESSAESQTRSWEAIKAAERASKHTGEHPPSALDGVSVALPGLTRAVKLQQRAARVGFDWPNVAGVLDKVEEEIGELRAELTAGARDADRIEDELGDVFFACSNLARFLEVDPERILRRANAKFERRFRAVEAGIRAQGKELTDVTLDDMEAEWQNVKRAEKPG